MKYFLVILGIIFTMQNVYANDVIHLAITEGTQTQEDIYVEGKDDDAIVLEQEYEDPNIQAQLIYNDLKETTPLLSKYTAMHFDKGPLESFNAYMVYQGNFNFNFASNGEYHTEYQNPLLDVNLQGKFKNAPIEFVSQYNLYQRPKYSYFQTFFKDQYLKFKYIPHNDIYVGQFKVPIGVEGCAGNYTMPFIYQSQIARNFGQVRAIGAKVMGDYKLVDYNVAVTSSDRFFTSFFPGAEFSIMGNIKPLGLTDGKYGELKIGGGINLGYRNSHYNVVSANISYVYKKLGITGEYAISNGSNGSTGFTTNKAQGAVVTVTYNLTRKLQLLARYDIFNPNMSASKKVVTEYVAGINYFIKGSSMKILLNYIYRTSQDGENSHRFLVGTQIIL